MPIVIGGIEASLRRIAHFDYWSEKVRRSMLLDAKADMLVFGNAERQICEIAHRLAGGASIHDITDLRGTVFTRKAVPEGWIEIDSTHLDTPGPLNPPIDPYAMEPSKSAGAPIRAAPPARRAPTLLPHVPRRAAAKRAQAPLLRTLKRWCASSAASKAADREHSVIRMPSFEQVSEDPVLYAHASRILHLEANPGNARALVQRHGDVDVWLNPPPIPLTTKEMDWVYELPVRSASRTRSTATRTSPRTR